MNRKVVLLLVFNVNINISKYCLLDNTLFLYCRYVYGYWVFNWTYHVSTHYLCHNKIRGSKCITSTGSGEHSVLQRRALPSWEWAPTPDSKIIVFQNKKKLGPLGAGARWWCLLWIRQWQGTFTCGIINPEHQIRTNYEWWKNPAVYHSIVMGKSTNSKS